MIKLHDSSWKLQQEDLLVVDFLCRTYFRKLQGAILNVESDMNFPMQLATFLNVIFNRVQKTLNVVVVCSNDTVKYWHYYLTTAKFKLRVQVLNSNCDVEDELLEPVALICRVDDLKLLEHFVEYQFVTAIVENIDQYVTKRILRNIESSFNIGLTSANFYLKPDENLQWKILNWSNPGCVGKQKDFYEVDNSNFYNNRDNYSQFWFTLTWNFYPDLKRPTEESKQILQDTIKRHAIEYNIQDSPKPAKVQKRRRKSSNDYTSVAKSLKEFSSTENVSTEPIEFKTENPENSPLEILENIPNECESETTQNEAIVNNSDDFLSSLFCSQNEYTNEVLPVDSSSSANDNEDDFLKSFILSK